MYVPSTLCEMFLIVEIWKGTGRPKIGRMTVSYFRSEKKEILRNRKKNYFKYKQTTKLLYLPTYILRPATSGS